MATLNHARFGHFGEVENSGWRLQAVLAYSGIAYKHLRAGEWSLDQQTAAQARLWIFSFLYGLLRPMDLILPYRMEGNVKLEVHEGKTMFEWWKPRLTEVLLKSMSVYAKMCRGSMARQLIGSGDTLESLRDFRYQGFSFQGERREKDGHLVLTFVKVG